MPRKAMPAAASGRDGAERGGSRAARGRASAAAEAGTDMDESQQSTRDRILDVALDLFTEQGFDKTSLREIAEALGFSKAALYYHFASKDDILMALHLRLHQLGRDAIESLGGQPVTPAMWLSLLDWFIQEVLANRKLFELHERNRAAFENLHREEHDQEHTDLEELIRSAMSNPGIPNAARVRMACSLGVVMGALLVGGDVFSTVPTDELGAELRQAVRDVLGPWPEVSPLPAVGAG